LASALPDTLLQHIDEKEYSIIVDGIFPDGKNGHPEPVASSERGARLLDQLQL
jgi:hypothetical protein